MALSLFRNLVIRGISNNSENIVINSVVSEFIVGFEYLIDKSVNSWAVLSPGNQCFSKTVILLQTFRCVYSCFTFERSNTNTDSLLFSLLWIVKFLEIKVKNIYSKKATKRLSFVRNLTIILFIYSLLDIYHLFGISFYLLVHKTEKI